MFLIFLLFHAIVYLEMVLLAKKKLRQKALILMIGNTIMTILNLLVLGGSLGNSYSSIVYLKNMAINHPILSFLWILINIAFYALIFLMIIIAMKKGKQTKHLKYGIYTGICFIFLVFLLMLFQNAFTWVFFLFLIGSIYLLVKQFLDTKKSSSIAGAILIAIILVYSYGTNTGAARLQIVFSGYPLLAYNTGLEELRYYKEENSKKYMPTLEIPTESGDMGIIEVKSYGLIKIGNYIGY